MEWRGAGWAPASHSERPEGSFVDGEQGALLDDGILFDGRALRGLGSALLCPAARAAANQVE